MEKLGNQFKQIKKTNLLSNHFAEGRQYSINRDGSVSLHENYFDYIFNTTSININIPSNPLGALGNGVKLPQIDLLDMPQPEKIELGWDIDQLDEAGLKDLKKRGRRLFDDDQRPVILFDGVCNFCNAYVNLILDMDPEGIFRFASLQSKVGQCLLLHEGRAPTDLSSIVLAEKDTHYTKSTAVLKVAEKLPLSNGLEKAASFSLIAPRFLRDGIYNVVSEHRLKIMGEREMCRFGDEDEVFGDRFIKDEEVQKPFEEESD